MSRIRRGGGFTLIEVMVSLAIFGLLAAFSYLTLNGIVEQSRIVGAEMTELQALQRTLQRMNLDFSQLVPRPVRDELGDGRQPSLRADARSTELVELTRGGWPNPLVLPRPTLQRVSYRIEEDRLIRRQWPVLDRTLGTEPAEATLLEGLQDIRLRYLTDAVVVLARSYFSITWVLLIFRPVPGSTSAPIRTSGSRPLPTCSRARSCTATASGTCSRSARVPSTG